MVIKIINRTNLKTSSYTEITGSVKGVVMEDFRKGTS